MYTSKPFISTLRILSVLAAFAGVSQTSQAAEGGYAGAVLADGPVAYFRFSDTLPVATNSGSLGAAANGTYNGDAAPGAQAPRSPAFYGFEADNTALQLDGAGDFVGSVAGLMNDMP